MDESMSEDMRGLVRGFADDLGYSQRQRGVIWRAARAFDYKSHKKALILGGMGIFAVIFLFNLIFGDNSGAAKEGPSGSPATSDPFEMKLSQLYGLEEKIAHLEMEQGKIQQELEELKSAKKALAKELDKMEKMPTSSASGNSATRTFHKVRAGDNLYDIARQYGISVGQLCRLNSLTRDQVIHPGQKLVVSPGSHE